MEIKTFEVRDRATFIPCLGIRIAAHEMPDGADKYLVRRAGYGQPMVLFMKLDGGQCQYDPYDWEKSARTIPEAHLYVSQHWHDLESGQVIDVEYIKGEKETRKQSERYREET